MAFDHKGNYTVVLQDGTGTPISYTVPDAGDFKFDGIEADNKGIVAIYNRLAYAGAAPTDERTITGSFSINRVKESWTHASNKRIADAVRGTGAWGSGVTVDPAGEVWMMDIVYSDGTNSVTFNTCRLMLGVDESSTPTKETVSFTCYQGVTLA